MREKNKFTKYLVWKSVLELETFTVRQISDRIARLLSTVRQIVHSMSQEGLIKKVGEIKTKGRPETIYKICDHPEGKKKVFDYVHSLSLDTAYILTEPVSDSYYEALKKIEEVKAVVKQKLRRNITLEEKEYLEEKINDAITYLNSAYYDNLAFQKGSEKILKKLTDTYDKARSLKNTISKIKVSAPYFARKEFLTILSKLTALKTVRINTNLFHDLILLALGKEKGWFFRENLNPEFIHIPWENTLEALEENEIDVANFNVNQAVEYNIEKERLVISDKVFQPIDNNFSIIIRGDSELMAYNEIIKENIAPKEARKKAIEALKGREIVTTENTDFEKGLKAVLALADLNIDDVEILDWDSFNGLKIFKKYSKGDAYIGGMLPRVVALERYKMRELISGKDVEDVYPSQVNSIITTREYHKSDPSVLAKLKRIIYQIGEYVSTHEEEAAAFIFKKFKIYAEKEIQDIISKDLIKMTLGSFKEYVRDEREAQDMPSLTELPFPKEVYPEKFPEVRDRSVIPVPVSLNLPSM